MVDEIIHWQEAAKQPPSSNKHVLAFSPRHGQQVDWAYFRCNSWFNAYGTPIPDGDITHWAEPPVGPYWER